VLFDEEGLCLPRDDAGELYKAILNELTEELWCEYDCFLSMTTTPRSSFATVTSR
jgi:hypothetical protein